MKSPAPLVHPPANLGFCDINRNCTGGVVIEDSIVKRSAIGLDVEVNDSVMQRNDIDVSSCPMCGKAMADSAKFCMECGEGLINS